MNVNIKKIGSLILLSLLLIGFVLMFGYFNSINTLKTLGYTKTQAVHIIKATNFLTIGTQQKKKLEKELGDYLYTSQEKIGISFDQSTIDSYPLKKQIQIIKKSNQETTTLLNQEIAEYSTYLSLKNMPYELKVKTPIYNLTLFNDLLKHGEKSLEKMAYTEKPPTTLMGKKDSLLTVLNGKFDEMKTLALEEGVDSAFFNGLDENILKKLNVLEDEINRLRKKKEEEKKVLQQKAMIQVSESGNSVPQSAGAMTYVNGILVVNKKHPLPPSYTPGENGTAGSEIRRLIADMQSQGLDVSNGYSGFRSYAYQSSLYQGYVSQDGQANADRYSARPGYSEHQTGLAFDLRHQSGQLVNKAKEADWLRAHSHEYGFIVRYLPGKESITGYMAEPWHLRYVGPQASSIAGSGLTLEEYLGIPGGNY